MSAPDFKELMARETPKLLACVHCGLCLDECPTYRTSGDETNSPRGRLALWRAEWEGRLTPGPETDHYTDLCVACLACTTACPANVPYAELLTARREEQARRRGADWRIRALSPLLAAPKLFNALASPLRLIRRLGLRPHPMLPAGAPAIFESSAAYARRVEKALRPSRSRAALFEGCLMEAAFREVNAATIRVLAVNGIAVDLPERQTCCGAVAEHAGMPAEKEKLDEANREAFAASALVLTNSSGCGLSLRHALGNAQQDVVDFLGTLDLVPGAEQFPPKAWYDHPCHAFHGLGIRTAPARLLKAAGLEGRWSLAPEADRCCGGGGAYAELQPESSRAILEEKRALLGPLPQGALLITSNHVCMMQWSRIPGLQVRHAVQVLDESYRLAGYYSKI